MLEPDHVTPYGIGAAFLLRTQEILEVVDERQVEFLQGNVVTAVYFRDELAKVPVYGTVAVVCSLYAAVSHFLDELPVVPFLIPVISVPIWELKSFAVFSGSPFSAYAVL